MQTVPQTQSHNLQTLLCPVRWQGTQTYRGRGGRGEAGRGGGGGGSRSRQIICIEREAKAYTNQTHTSILIINETD